MPCRASRTKSPASVAAERQGALFDYLIGARDKRRRQFDAQCLRDAEIDSEIELGGTFERQVAGFCAFQYANELRDEVTGDILDIGPEGHKASLIHPFGRRKDRRLVAQVDQLEHFGDMSAEHNIRNEYECIEAGENVLA